MGRREMSDEQQERRRVDDSWHLSKTVSISQIMTIVVLGTSFIWQVAIMDKRLALLENKEVVTIPQHQGLETRVSLLEQYSRMTRDSLERIEVKLDRLVERSNFDR